MRAETDSGRTREECPYVTSVRWKGEAWGTLWIGHAELMQGGELVFRVSADRPARKEYAPDDLSFSVSPYRDHG